MDKTKISGGTVHKIPEDLRKALASVSGGREAWEGLTPLARNEFICWVEDAKKPETREHRIKRTSTEVAEGKRRPCCWIGCVHRKDKEMSSSQKWVMGKRSKR